MSIGKIHINKMIFVFIAMSIALSLATKYFFSLANMADIFSQVAIYGITALGLTFVFISGEIDLSVGSVMALSGIILCQVGKFAGYGPAIVTALAVSLVIGAFHAFLLTKFRISSLVITLATMTMLKGISLLILETTSPIKSKLLLFYGAGQIGYIPIIFIFFIVYLIILDFVLKRTRFGRNTYAIGDNADAATKAGISVTKNKYLVLMLCSFSAAIAGILLSSKLAAASPLFAADAGVSSFSAIVIGGTSMSGGKGGVMNTLIGVLIMGLVRNAISQFGVSTFYITLVNGAVLIIVVCIDSFIRTRHSFV